MFHVTGRPSVVCLLLPPTPTFLWKMEKLTECMRKIRPQYDYFLFIYCSAKKPPGITDSKNVHLQANACFPGSLRLAYLLEDEVLAFLWTKLILYPGCAPESDHTEECVLLFGCFTMFREKFVIEALKLAEKQFEHKFLTFRLCCASRRKGWVMAPKAQ